MTAPHLFIALSSHGFGHLAQLSPVVNALCERIPHLRLTLQSDLPEWKLQSRIDWPFELIRQAPDVVIPMAGPTKVLWPETFQAYRDFHADWDDRMVAQQHLFTQSQPDLLLADVPYLPLAAAAKMGIPAIAFCSLSWLDILLEHPQAEAELAEPLEVMRQSYSAARCFIQPEPSIPMEWLPNRCPVGPIAAPGQDCRNSIVQALGIGSESKLVVVGLGGISSAKAHRNWPQQTNVHWLVDSDDWIDRPDVHDQAELNVGFRDLVCSADVFITKPGYGSFTEAAGCGIPVLNVARERWAETPYLEAWLEGRVPFETISLEQLQAGDFVAALARLLEHSQAEPSKLDGVDAAVEILLPWLGACRI
jgi:hypothetical protein